MRTQSDSEDALGMSPFQAAEGGWQGKGPCKYRIEDKGMRQGELRHPAIIEVIEDRVLRTGVTKLPLVVRLHTVATHSNTLARTIIINTLATHLE
jgi:hypothetical protein